MAGTDHSPQPHEKGFPRKVESEKFDTASVFVFHDSSSLQLKPQKLIFAISRDRVPQFHHQAALFGVSQLLVSLSTQTGNRNNPCFHFLCVSRLLTQLLPSFFDRKKVLLLLLFTGSHSNPSITFSAFLQSLHCSSAPTDTERAAATTQGADEP